MVGSLKIGATVVTTYIKKAVDGRDNRVVKTRLLDGTYQVQTIGTALKYYNIVCFVTNDDKILLDDCYAISDFITFYLDGKYYKGLLDDYPSIDDTIQSDSPGERWFTATMRLNVVEEGWA